MRTCIVSAPVAAAASAGVRGFGSGARRVAAVRAVDCSALSKKKTSFPALLSAGLSLAAGPALADISELSYPGLDPIVENSTSSIDAVDVSDMLSNPLLIGGAVAALGVPLIISLFSRGSVQSVSPAAAFEALAEDPATMAIDLRNSATIKQSGSPDLRSTKKKLFSVPFSKVVKGEVVTVDQEAFVASLSRVANPEKATLVLIDNLGGESQRAAKLAAEAGFSTVLVVKGGCEGSRGWKASALPWKEPFKGIDLEAVKSLDITGMTKLADKLAKDFEENPTAVKGGIAVAAAGAAAFVLFNEVEIILEVLGVWAAANFLAKKLLFAEDREKTLSDFKSLLKDKIAAGEAGEDLQKLGSALISIKDVAQVQAFASVAPEPESEAEAEPEPEAKDVDSDIEERRAEVRAWVEAWKERSKVSVMA